MTELANLLERIVGPMLRFLDATGMFSTLRFAPFHRLVAALLAVVLVAYTLAIVLYPVAKRIAILRRVRIVGRLVSVALAALLTYSILTNTAFLVGRSGGGPFPVARSDLALLLLLGLMLFLEIRLWRSGS